MTAAATLREDRSRAVKATRIARHLIVRGDVDVAEIAAYDDDQRLEACLRADVRPASDRTWSVAVGIVQALVDLTADAAASEHRRSRAGSRRAGSVR